jgi:5'-nucleotidase
MTKGAGTAGMRTLITNDDGLTSPGISLLAATARDFGLDIMVAAPSWDSSGSSASLAAVEHNGRFLMNRRALDALDGVTAVAVEAAPAFIVRAAFTGAFGPPPRLVLSGVNHGANVGRAVLHSGTVGAALTASTHSTPALAVSAGAPALAHPETAQAVVRALLPTVMGAAEAHRSLVLNVNVPDRPLGELQGLCRARLADFGAVQANVTELGKGHLNLQYTADEVRDEQEEDDSDATMLSLGYATVTPLLAICEATDQELSLPAMPAASRGAGSSVGRRL